MLQSCGGNPVPSYRLYELDGAGNFSAAEWIEADDDAAAAGVAHSLEKTCRCELWHGPAFVATIHRSRPVSNDR